ncbi:threonine ammonia-lyase [Fusobacterium gonidiaformans 3-1-5R]|uniref:threonine ammonia-lyase n=1 Tax=Fusobacterium gonidiaformans 3-1-5R TaxID=469605 RepID=E5BGA7_9FUSO|nr:threonine ammonia-lyase [Fusobacterium gonidiaformans]AVQ16639.1 threonine ammonia-lyase [Fusobacterium gonidiaformans ATCC 25563]EFS21530.1 threonine ammonia-lyase [Fusobacterium gonidiaformans 3-1-5R]EFS28212.1 threonine dehydratase [Fusobacterium gonidiaformans ATCC 25563]
MVTLEKIQEAKSCIQDSVRKTPVLNCPKLGAQTGNDVYFKLENLQQTGSFKLRGALNKIAHLSEEEKKCGVIASSAGNHAQGVALGATAKGIKSTIVMPAGAPLSKVRATREYGAEVVLHGAVYDNAYQKALEIQKETGAIFLHPFDDEEVIAGQGTIGLEILEQLPDVDAVLVPIGGGGILAGIATAIKSVKPEVKVIGVEAAGAASMTAALAKGECCDIENCSTIADGIAVRKVGYKTLELVKKYVDEVVTVTEDEIVQGIFYLLEKSKLVAEGAGASGVAALLAGKINLKGKKVCAVISGGNVDMNFIEKIVNKALVLNGQRHEITVYIPDKPGEMEKLTRVLHEQNANIIYISQTKYRASLAITEVKVDLVVECRDEAHQEEIHAALEKNGARIAK